MQWKAPLAVVVLASIVGGCNAVSPSRRLPREHAAPAATSSRWRVDTPGEPGAIVADARGSVVLAGPQHVVALDHDGRERWRAQVRDRGVEYPAIDRELVVVSTDTGDAGAFIVLDRATGEERWRADVTGLPGPVTVTSTAVFATTDAGAVHAFTRTGALQWRAELPVSIASRGNLAYDEATRTVALVVFAKRRGWVLVLLDARTGENVGGLDLGASEPPSAVVAAGDGRLVLGLGRTHEFAVIDLRARVVAHAVRTTSSFDPSSHPAVDGDLAVVVDALGTVTAIDVRTGVQRWQRALGQPMLGARPQLDGTTVVLAGFAGPVTALAVADGRPVTGAFPGLAGVPVAVAFGGGLAVVSLRFAAPGRVEAWGVR